MSNQRVELNDLYDFYTLILSLMSATSDENGLIVERDPGWEVVGPLMVGEDRLVMPTRTILTTNDWNDKVAFHPVCENIYRGESKVIKKIRSKIVETFNIKMLTLLSDLTGLCSVKEQHETLSAKQTEILQAFPKADARSDDDISKLIKNAIGKSERYVASIHLKRSGKIYGGDDFSRCAIVRFPLYEELADESKKSVWGVTLRKQDRVGLKRLLEYIFPDIGDKDAYSGGSSSLDAPYLDALLKAANNLIRRFDTVTYKFRKHVDHEEMLSYRRFGMEDLHDHLKALPQYSELLPTLEGNEGTVSKNETAAKQGNTSPPWDNAQPQQSLQGQPMSQPQHPMQQNSYPQQPQQPQNNPPANGKLSFNDLMSTMPQQQMGYPQQQMGMMGPPPTPGLVANHPRNRFNPTMMHQQMQQPMPQQQMGYPQQQMPQQQFPQQQMQFPQQQMQFPQQQMQYPQQQYPQQQMGYPQQQMPQQQFPQQQMQYPQQQYPQQQMGYPQQMGHSQQQSVQTYGTTMGNPSVCN